MHVCICLFVCRSVCLSVSLSVSVCLSVCLSEGRGSGSGEEAKGKRGAAARGRREAGSGRQTAPEWGGEKKRKGNGRQRRPAARRVDGLREGMARKKGPWEGLDRRLWKKATTPRSPAATQSAPHLGGPDHNERYCSRAQDQESELSRVLRGRSSKSAPWQPRSPAATARAEPRARERSSMLAAPCALARIFLPWKVASRQQRGASAPAFLGGVRIGAAAREAYARA